MGFRFIQITDHHIMATAAMLSRGFSPAHALRATLRHIATHHGGVDFVVSTGDLVDRGIDAEYATFRAMLGLEATSRAPGPQRARGEGLGLRSTHFSFAQAGDEWVYALRPPQYRVVTVDDGVLRSEVVEVAL